MLAWEAQVGRERLAVVEQAGRRSREELLVLGGKGANAALDEADRFLPWSHAVGDVEDLPVRPLQFLLGMFRRFGKDISTAVHLMKTST